MHLKNHLVVRFITAGFEKISLIKEYNDYLILGVPTRFFRDWIVSRYLDKILEQVKGFKLSLNRIEFNIIEENKKNQDTFKIDELNKVTEINDLILNYNRLNLSSILTALSRQK